MKIITLMFALFFSTGSTFSQGPGEIISFNAEKINNAVMLTWSPSIVPETNHFEIQKSDDGVNWKTIALMFPYEDGSVAHDYKYSDKIGSDGNVHYRIRQIDINKKESFSQIKMIGATAQK